MNIQFFDETGNPIPGLENVDYEGTVWAEGQLTDEDEDAIEHLEIGDATPISGGWFVRRIS